MLDVALSREALQAHRITHILNVATGVKCAFPNVYM